MENVNDEQREDLRAVPGSGRVLWRRIASLWTPETYHGWGISSRWFEGWYFKVVDPSERIVLAMIPGVFHGEDPKASHAFIQVLDGVAGAARYNRYPLEDFAVSSGRPFRLKVGENRFSCDSLHLDVPGPRGRVRGRITMGELYPWPVTPLSPGVMGPYTFVPFMQCYHGILSFDHVLSGRVSIGDREVDFEGGRGYTERDWGRSFPRAWIWMQSNHFERYGISLSLSIATIPWLGSGFTGLIAGLLLDGKLYRFTTYGRTRIREANISPREVEITLENDEHRLRVRADRGEGATLLSPEISTMQPRVVEDMTGEVRVSLEDRRKGNQLYSGLGRCAAIEVVGDSLARSSS
ncbi:MAG: tocopherol cyclase family protein [Bacillota bacterium]